MAKAKDLTKEYLMYCGVTDITPDGQIYVHGKIIPQYDYQTTTKYPYKYVYLHDKKLRTPKHHGGVHIRVHRAVYAWYHGVTPANLDVDHINNIQCDNRIENLQLLTRLENNRKRDRDNKK